MKAEDKKVLDVGCGKHKIPGSIGMDIVALDGVDVVHNVNVSPWPFEDNTFDEIIMSHLIEHCDSIPRLMEEVHRVSKNGAIIKIITPHYTDMISWSDITHKWHLNTSSFKYFLPDYSTNYYSKARFETLTVYVEISNLFKYMGFEILVNLVNINRIFRFIRRFWELYLCFIIRGKTMHITLKTIK